MGRWGADAWGGGEPVNGKVGSWYRERWGAGERVGRELGSRPINS